METFKKIFLNYVLKTKITENHIHLFIKPLFGWKLRSRVQIGCFLCEKGKIGLLELTLFDSEMPSIIKTLSNFMQLGPFLRGKQSHPCKMLYYYRFETKASQTSDIHLLAAFLIGRFFKKKLFFLFIILIV